MSTESNKMAVEQLDVKEDYVPVVYKLGAPTDDIFKYNENPQISINIPYPKFSFGFHHYIHQSKDKMEFVKDFENKKKVYLIMSKFERYVDDYEADVNNVSKAYFDIGPKPNILSRAFYKIWELFFMFDLIPLDNSNFVTAHLAEGPGSFIQATMFYRDKFSKKGVSKNDKYYAITLHGEDINKHVPPLEESFIEYYKKEKPQRFMLHKTYSKDIARQSTDKDNGDLTDKKTRTLFGGSFKDAKADLVTADGGFDWDNENVQEQEAEKLILSQILTALQIQNANGNFICKIYESFTVVTAKFIEMLRSFYKEVYIVKPLMSRASNSEKYIVCLKFKESKDNVSKIKKIEHILDEMTKYPGKNLVNLFSEYELNEETKALITSINTTIANTQFININEQKVFVDKQNYRGEEYDKRREMQIDASKYWLDTFFPESKDFDAKTNSIHKFVNKIVTLNNQKSNALKSQLDFN